MRYGDAFFETMLYTGGKFPLFALHLERILKTCDQLQMLPPKVFETVSLETKLLEFLQKKGLTTARVRINFWRNGGGTYLPNDNNTSYFAEASAISPKYFALNEKGLTLDIYRDTWKNTDFLANLKLTGCHTYTLASMWAQKEGLDDAIILNHHGRIAECTSSNIFLVMGKTIITPPLSEGCLDGVMRRHLLTTLPQKGLKVKEQPIELKDLKKADEIFTTNALGIKWVGEVRGIKKSLTNTISSDISFTS